MSSQVYRKYIDIINENSQPEMLTEGMIQDLISKVKSKISSIPADLKKEVANLVTKALGKPLDQLSMSDITLTNAKKVAAANSQLGEGDYERGDTPTWRRDRQHGEVEEIPGSYAKDKTRQTALGGTLGAIMGTGAAAMIAPMSAIGLPVAIMAGLIGLIMALIFRGTAEPEYGAAGFRNNATRDPRLPARSDRPAAMQIGQYPTQKPVSIK